MNNQNISDILYSNISIKSNFFNDFFYKLEKYIDILNAEGKNYLKTEAAILILNNILGDKVKKNLINTNNFIFSFPKYEIAIISYIDSIDDIENAIDFYYYITDRIVYYIQLYEYSDLLGEGREKSYKIKHIILNNNITKEEIDKKINNMEINYKLNFIENCDKYIEEIFSLIEKKDDYYEVKVVDSLRSILTQSINDSKEVNNLSQLRLDKIQNAIKNYDKKQLNFLYLDDISKPIIKIQGIAGSGKTFLFLHKLIREYIENPNSTIMMTCHNKSLVWEFKKNIITLANVLKVKEQIDWKYRLHISHAWDIYKNICNTLQIKYYKYDYRVPDPLKYSCSLTIKDIKELNIKKHIYNTIFIDEAQDLPNEWIELCSIISEKVYVAFDIFQNIFDNKDLSKEAECDYTLKNCYRTPPLLLMFGHCIAMGLFEEKKIQWFDEPTYWNNIGYDVEGNPKKDKSELKLTRSPLSRFENEENEQSLYFYDFSTNKSINDFIDIIEKIKINNNLNNRLHEIIIIDSRNNYNESQKLASTLEANGIELNNLIDIKKRSYDNKIQFTNINNVKGLEFGFVIIIGLSLERNIQYRNSLYMSITRAMLEAHIICFDQEEYYFLNSKYKELMKNKCIITEVPNSEERKRILKEINTIRKTMTIKEYIIKRLENHNYNKDKKEFIDKFFEICGNNMDINNLDQLNKKIDSLISLFN